MRPKATQCDRMGPNATQCDPMPHSTSLASCLMKRLIAITTVWAQGVYSSADQRHYRAVKRALFAGHPIYSIDSGGDPRAIPTLTYEAFESFHRTYYHPANAVRVQNCRRARIYAGLAGRGAARPPCARKHASALVLGWPMPSSRYAHKPAIRAHTVPPSLLSQACHPSSH